MSQSFFPTRSAIDQQPQHTPGMTESESDGAGPHNRRRRPLTPLQPRRVQSLVAGAADALQSRVFGYALMTRRAKSDSKRETNKGADHFATHETTGRYGERWPGLATRPATTAPGTTVLAQWAPPQLAAVNAPAS